ncbi:hypothetical protein NKH00_32960 [Mesorhizobium sp. M1405]
MTSKTTNKFSPEVRNRAVRMVLDHERERTLRVPGISGHRVRQPAISAARARLADHGLKGIVVWALGRQPERAHLLCRRRRRRRRRRPLAEGVEIFEQKALKKVAFVWE